MTFLYLSLSRLEKGIKNIFMTNLAKAHNNYILPMVKQKAQTHDRSHALKKKWPTYSPPTISHLDPSLMTLFSLKSQ